MNPNQSKLSAAFTLLISVVAWFAVVLQFVISVPQYLEKGRTLGGAVVQLLSYFTILSNILVAVSLMVIVVIPKSGLGKFFSKPTTSTAIAVYITIVGLVYNLVLRQVWEPKGLFKLDNELLHVAIPVLYLLYWIFISVKTGLTWKQIPGWLIFPFLYMIYIILRGAGSGFYPYFFMDVKRYGYGQVALNCLLLLIVFCLFCTLFVFVGRKIQQRNTDKLA